MCHYTGLRVYYTVRMADDTTLRNIVLSTHRDVRPLVESWVRSLRADGKSHRTIENYAMSVRALSAWCDANGAPIDPARQTTDHVRRFVAAELETNARGSVVLRFRCLQQWFKWLIGEDELDVSPMAKMSAPKLTETVVPVLSEDQLKNLLAVTSGRDWLDRRDHAIIRTFVDTGMRMGELVGLRMVDVDLDHQTLLVLGKGDRYRLAPIGDKTAVALDRYIRARDRRPHAASPMLWLGTRGTLGSNGVGAMLRVRGEQAGVEDLHAHRFRHTAAHRWLAAGGTEGDLMRIAGWKNPAMLQRYGRSAAEERARDAHKRLKLGDSL